MSEQDSSDVTRSFVPLSQGVTVGHYRIVRKIGAGGMGEVYLAEDTELDRNVALKFLPSFASQNESSRARFLREARAAARLNHPNIVTVYDVGECGGRPFFAMEHLEGHSLHDLIKRGDLPFPQTVSIAIQICEGLQEAHGKGIIHRDIKPSNICCDNDGRCKILDFGLASILGSEHLTKTGSTLGTVGYMSPEQVRGEQVDHRSDLFSLGVVLYEMITGRQPFHGDHDTSTSRNILDAEPEPLARYKTGVDPELQRIVGKTLAKDKNARYQHADDLAADLRLLVSASGHQVVKPAKTRWRIPLLVALAALLALAIILKPWQWTATGPADNASSRIAIVPFRNETGDLALDPLGRMLSDWTTQSLLGTGLAEVVSPEALLPLDPAAGIRSIADATHAGILVTGSYYRVGDSLQFQAKISTDDEELLQAVEPVYAPLTEPMAGIETVRRRLVGALALLLDKKMAGLAVADVGPPTYEAYQEYLQGCDDFFRLFDYSGAAQHYLNAHDLDTSFLMPLLLGASALANAGQTAESDSLLQFLSERRSRLTVVLQLHLEWLQRSLVGDLTGTLDAARRGAALAPGSIFEYVVGISALALNRPHESIAAFKRWNFDVGFARDWWPNWVHYQEAHHFVGEHQKELEIARKGRERFPNSVSLLNAELEALAALGRTDDLSALIDEAFSWPPQPGFSPANSARIAAAELRAHGHETEAMAVLDRLLDWYRNKPPDQPPAVRLGYATTLYDARRWEEARAVFADLARDSLTALSSQMNLGLIAARLGDRETALTISRLIEDLSTPDLAAQSAYNRACIAALLGEKEQAVSLLKESFRQEHTFTLTIHRDLDFESLRDYPPFIALLKPKG